MKRWFAVLALVAVPALYRTAQADRGSIPFKPHVQVFEPTQRAMLAWSGQEEILLLTTDLKASEPTKVLEVMPFPSEPKVKKGDTETFRRATHLINAKLGMPRPRGRNGGRSKSAPAHKPGGEITFHEKIGAHDISTAHVLDGKRFVEWVNEYLKKSGVDNPVVPPAMTANVDTYIAEGYSWFVFDVVELDDEPKTNEAIQYRFHTDALYYPLKISQTFKGHTSIELLVLTPRLLSRFTGIPIERVTLLHKPIAITAPELRGLDEDMDDLLGHRNDMKLRIWGLRGTLSSFDKDLIAR
ncbi:MAG: DUF2330 domain-containing protein [Phycisphaerae bacterium]|nr:DUF2330 domain-containing protein [Phycisphaerae bacterium]